MSQLKMLIVGAGDHCRVLLDVIYGNAFPQFRDWQVVALIDDDPGKHGTSLFGIRVVGGRDQIARIKEQSGVNAALVGIGISSGTLRRAEYFHELQRLGFQFPVLVHPRAIIASHVELGHGSVVLAGALVGTGTRIGRNVIVNVGASVSHDCDIGDHAVICDGAILTGAVRVGERALIGAGATVNPYVVIGRDAIVGAGSVVTRNVEQGVTVVGVPARPLEKG